MSYKLSNDIALKVKKRLDETKMTKQSLADKLGIARSTLWRFLEGKGETIFNDEQMQFLSSFLNCSLKDVTATERKGFEVCEFFAPTFNFIPLENVPTMNVDCLYLGIDDESKYKAILSACSYEGILYDDRLLICIDDKQVLLSDKLYYLVLEDQVCIRRLKTNPFSGEVYICSEHGEFDITYSNKEWKEKVKHFFRIVALERYFK